MAKEIIVTADKVKKRKTFNRIIKLSLLLLLLLLIVVYIILQVIYSDGSFSIIPNSQATIDSGISMYDNLDDPTPKRKLSAPIVSDMDNISWKWLPEKIDTESDGSHNGKDYIAYSFYIENQGKERIHYWYQVIVDDVIKEADDAIRIAIYQNGEKKTYAKASPLSGDPETTGAEGGITIPFLTDKTDDEDTIILEKRANFSPGDLDRYTIVVWLEGDDPECVDAIKGGLVKMHMKITEERIIQ